MRRSHGVRIPKSLLDQTGLQGEVEICADGSALIVGRAGKPRAGWDDAFAEMANRGDDTLLDGNLTAVSSWDEVEWEW